MTDHLWQLVALFGLALALAVALGWINLKAGSGPSGHFLRWTSFWGMVLSFSLAACVLIGFAVTVLS